jgi:hypothetical protein
MRKPLTLDEAGLRQGPFRPDRLDEQVPPGVRADCFGIGQLDITGEHLIVCKTCKDSGKHPA